MSGSVRVSGTYRDLVPHVKVGSTWRFSPEAWVNVSGSWKKWFLAGGIFDSDLAAGAGANSAINSVLVQPDGKIVLGGSFTTWSGATANRILRLNADGTKDTSFSANIGTAANNAIFTMALQSDGKIIAAGNLTSWNGAPVGRIVRLNANGTRDTAFTTNTGTGSFQAAGTIYTILLQSDGKILLGGLFTRWDLGVAPHLIRLNSDGTTDAGFLANLGTGSNNVIYSMTVQHDTAQSVDRIILGGNFTTWNGVAASRILCLNSDGTRNTLFDTSVGSAASDTVYVLGSQSDGRTIVTGFFLNWNGAAATKIVRLNLDGSRDTTFDGNVAGGPNNNIYAVAVQPDDKIVLAGEFTIWNNSNVGRIVRLNADGTREVAFNNNSGTGAATAPYSIAVAPDGKLAVSGNFTSFNGNTVGRICRIGGDRSS